MGTVFFGTFPARAFRAAAAVLVLTAAPATERCGIWGADDGPRPAWTSSRLRGAPTPPEPFRIEPAFPALKFDHPTCLQEIPGADRFLATEIGGKVWTFPDRESTATADLAMDLKAAAGGDVSLFAAVVHPQFEQNRFVYFCLVHPAGGSHTRVSRFEMSRTNPPTIDPASETEIIRWPSGGHNAGCLRFGNDGFLYLATGDGSGPNPPDGLTTGQDVSDLLGAILRIDVDRPDAGRNYSIPRDNPFVTSSSARPEIFGYGLRNPWKFGIDRQTGEVFVADNGWETWELIYLVGPGTNCGWPIMEGRARLRPEVAPGPTPITPPIRDHHHSEANSVIGGPVYRGEALPGLNGQFLYGDYITGTIWSVGRSADGSFLGQTLVDTDLRITDFLETTDGQVLVVDYDLTGQIYELLPNKVEDLSSSFPGTLSQTGLFESLAPLQPAAGVIVYDVTVPQWNDGARAERFVAIPGSATIELAADNAKTGTYPDGTAFVKHLTVPAEQGGPGKPLETQVLLYQYGRWSPYAYIWNEAGTEATLAPTEGAARSIAWPDPEIGATTERTWRTGATNECRLCHNAGPGFVLGFVGNQLARKLSAAAGSRDQLASLRDLRVISSLPDSTALAAARLVDPHDAAADLNDRARSYLHGNCSMCHHVGGNAIVSFFVTRDLPFERMNTNKGTGIGTFGLHDAKIIADGDPYRSLMLYRMSKLGYARMPYVGSQVVDGDGVALIEQWIRSLPADGKSRSAPLTPDSPEAAKLAVLGSAAATGDARSAAIQHLLGSTESSLAVASRMHAGTIDAEDRKTIAALARNSRSDIRGLFETFVPESERKKTLGRTFDPAVVLSGTGDAARGRLIFASDTARCRACHHADQPALSTGPALKDIAKKYPQAAELLQHVVEPSRKIDEPFAAWTLVTGDGRVVNGLLEKQNDQEIVLKTADQKRTFVPRADVETLQRSTTSLMPEGVLADLTPEEAADLLAFIHSLADTQ